MMLVPHTVSRVMKSRSTQLVCTMVTVTGHPRVPGRPITLPLLEEASRCSREHVKDATEPCIRSMTCWWIRVSLRLSS
jgi:hypothetical protein